MYQFFTSLFAASVIATSAASDHADHPTTQPIAVVHHLFDAMRAGDGSKVRDLVVEGAALDRALPDGSRRAGTFEGWADWVDQQNEGDADEQIYGVTSVTNGRLAAVVAPFTVYLKGKLVACGRNHFTLMKIGGAWKIVHGMDEPFQGDCAAFRKTIEG